MDRQNIEKKQNLKSRQQINSERQALFTPAEQTQTQVQSYLNQFSDKQLEKKLQENDRSLNKQQNQEADQQQEAVLKHAGETLQNVQRKLEETRKQKDPEKIVSDVKQELNLIQNPPQQIKSNYRQIMIDGQLVPRQNFKRFLQTYLQEYEYPQKGKELFAKYAVFNKGKNRILTSSQLQLNASLFLDKLRAYQSGRQQVSMLLHRIDTQQDFIQRDPHRWYSWFLKKKGLLNNRILYAKAINDTDLQKQQVKNRLEQLNNKKIRINSQLENYVQKSNKRRNRNIKQYAKMMQAKDQLHTTQKSVLTFLIDKKGKQILDLNNKITNEQNQFKQFKQNVEKQVTQWQEDRQKTEDKLLQEIKQIQLSAQSQKQKVLQKQIQEAKLKQQLEKKKQDERKLLNSLQIKVKQQNEIVKKLNQKATTQHTLRVQLEKKDQMEVVLIKQLNKKNEAQIAMIQQQKVMIEELRVRDRVLTQKAQYQDELIKYQQRLIEESKQKEKLLQLKFEEELKLRRQHEQLLFQIQNEKKISNRKTQIQRLKSEQLEKVKNINLQLGLKSKNLEILTKQTTQKIGLLNQEIKKHKTQLLKNDETHKTQIQQLKTKMLQAGGFHENIIKQKEQALRQAQLQYDKLKTHLSGRQAQYQKYVEDLNKTLQIEKQQKMKLLNELDGKNKQNQALYQQYQNQINSISSRMSNQLLASKMIVQKQIDAHVTALKNEKNKSNGLQKEIQAIQKSKKDYELKITNRMKQIEKQKQDAEKKLAKMSIDLSLSQNKLKQLKKAPQYFQLSFKYWWNAETQLYTIRQCFRPKQENKWIATIRGINFNKQQKKGIEDVLQRWSRKQRQNITKQMIKGTQIIEIIDQYKGKLFYSLRQIYYYAGEVEPTRRGFNIAYQDLNSFFRNINKITPSSQISN